MNVFLEAILVGLFLIPVFWVAEKIASPYGKFAVVFVAGALFHLAAEALGINQAYVAMKK
jgi:hypothetical protein